MALGLKIYLLMALQVVDVYLEASGSDDQVDCKSEVEAHQPDGQFE